MVCANNPPGPAWWCAADAGANWTHLNKDFGLVTEDIGPYPFHISRDRVTDEDSKVTFTNPESRLLNYPNKITEEDFNGWIQERGVYFPDKWDPKYKTVLACHDPGEADLDGGLLYTSYGKGTFIYTGYDWFRELPAGIPGACRLFVNMIEAELKKDKKNWLRNLKLQFLNAILEIFTIFQKSIQNISLLQAHFFSY